MKNWKIIITLLVSIKSFSTDIKDIVEVLKYTETDNRIDVIGDSGKAYGILQIHKICVDDVNRIYGTSYTHEQMFDEELAEEVACYYLEAGVDRYRDRYNKDPTEEQIVRMFNGGIYQGYRKDSTDKYYERYLFYRKQLIDPLQTLIFR